MVISLFWKQDGATDSSFCVASTHLSVDHKLPHRPEATGEAGEHHIQHLDNQHWQPPGMCALPTALLDQHTNDYDTTVISLIRDVDKSAYRWEAEQLALRCSQNNLELNMLKIMTILKWVSNIDLIRKKAQQRMYFLRQLRKFNLLKELLIHWIQFNFQYSSILFI